jgi:hypothetical protein
MIMKKWVSIDVGLGSMAMALLTGMAKQKSAIAMHKDKSNHGSKIHKNGTVFSLSLSQWRCWVWLAAWLLHRPPLWLHASSWQKKKRGGEAASSVERLPENCLLAWLAKSQQRRLQPRTASVYSTPS